MLLGAVGVIEFRGQDKSMFRPRKVFGNKYARPKHEGKRKIFHETEGLTLRGLPEHGNTFAPEIVSLPRAFHQRQV
ncbi:hypothetical protein D0T85_00835 [Bacteroides sp. 519]|nr:hypothetical protein [Bacteroides sp. 519]